MAWYVTATVQAEHKPIPYEAISDAPRILIECELKPVQGHRFQPTGFPSLGAAEYAVETKDGQVNCVLVDSHQSIANWLERVCMDGTKLEGALEGLPVVTLVDSDGEFIGNTMTEAHRVASPYLLQWNGKSESMNGPLADRLKSDLDTDDKPPSTAAADFAKFLLRHDPATILHGAFVPKLAGGKYRLTRMLSGFTEATGARPVDSGGSKFDNIDSTGKADGKGGSDNMYGNVLYPRRDYTARRIMLYFSIDLTLMRSYGLGEAAEQLLFALAVWKMRRLTRHEIRFRSGCDLRAAGDLKVTLPDGYELPGLEEAEADLKRCIKRCREESLFADKDIVVTRRT